MDKRGLLRLALAVLARQVHRQGQEPGAQEAGYTSGYQVDETEPWTEERWTEKKKGGVRCGGGGGLLIVFLGTDRASRGSRM